MDLGGVDWAAASAALRCFCCLLLLFLQCGGLQDHLHLTLSVCLRVDLAFAHVVLDQLAGELVFVLRQIRVARQFDALFLREVDDLLRIGEHDRLVGLHLLLIVRAIAFGDDANHELILQFDGHLVAGHRHRALLHPHGAVIDRDVLVLVELGRIGMDVDRLFGIFRQCQSHCLRRRTATLRASMRARLCAASSLHV